MMRARNHSRELTLKTGKLSTGESALSIDCAILDISDDGACILVPNAAEIPATFTLTVDLTETTHSCVIKWRTGNRIGVSFAATSVTEDWS